MNRGYECRYNAPKATGFPIVAWDVWCRHYKPDNLKIEKVLERRAVERKKELERQKGKDWFQHP